MCTIYGWYESITSLKINNLKFDNLEKLKTKIKII